MKYNGKNISFTFKLTTFHEIYTKADVPPEIPLNCFLILFTSLVLDYYYLNTNTSIISIFEEVCTLIQTYFEKTEYKKRVLSK